MIEDVGRTRRTATLIVSCLAQLLVAIDMTVLHLAIPALTTDLGASAEQLLWIADIYGFAMGGLLITMGNLGDRLGRRKMLLLGVGAFALVSLFAAYAPSPETLIAARALLGVAGSAVLPSTTSLVRAVFTEQKSRTAAVGATAGVSAAGFALGPIVGGILLDHFWWGSVFLVNVPVAAGIFVVALKYVPESRSADPQRLDVLSVVLSVVGIIGLIYALKGAFYAGLFYPDVLGSLAIGVVALVLFGRRQKRLTQPLIDLRLFKRRAFSASVGSNLVSVFTMSAFALITSQYFQLVLGWTPLKAGLAFVPGALAALFAGGVLAAKLVQSWGRATTVAAGLGLAAVGFSVFSQVEPESSYWLVMIAQIAFGAGAGLTLTVTGDTILGTVPRDRAGAASAISATAYEMGGSLGIAVIGSVLSGAYRAELHLPDGVPSSIADQVRDSFSATRAAVHGLPGPVASAVEHAAAQAFVGGIKVSMIGSAGVMVVLALTALVTMRGVPKVIEEPAEPEPELSSRTPR